MAARGEGGVMSGLRPEFVDLLDRLPVLNLDDPARFRADLARARDGRVSATHPQVEVTEVQIPLRAGEPTIAARIYRPRPDADAKPGLVFCHGGGFVTGSPDSEHARCLRFAAEAGALVVSPDYRLAPEHRYPAGLEDCKATLAWLQANASVLGVEETAIALGGTSAGAALAVGVALSARDEGCSPVAGLILVCPVTDDSLRWESVREFWRCRGWNGAAAAAMWRHYLPAHPRKAPYAVPNRADSLSGLPPVHLVVADLDPLRDEALAFADRLASEDVPVVVDHVLGVPHGFDALLPGADVARQSVGRQIRCLRDLGARRDLNGGIERGAGHD